MILLSGKRAPVGSVVALLCLAFHLAACTTWRVNFQRPEQLMRENPPSPVRVTGAYDGQVVLHGPRIVADSLVGVTAGDRDTLAIPLSDVRILETRQISTCKTLGLVWLLGWPVSFILFAASGGLSW
jgi:hypothetical protein